MLVFVLCYHRSVASLPVAAASGECLNSDSEEQDSDSDLFVNRNRPPALDMEPSSSEEANSEPED